MNNTTTKNLISLKEACKWASYFLQKEVNVSNISYLVQYGKIKKYYENGISKVDIKELEKYYTSFNHKRKQEWKQKLGQDLNWKLSFDNLKEKDTTKHVHRLHPYKGKFIPQLVEYFLDSHIDNCKSKTFFKQGDIVLDPFAGSGTTLVQANELGIHSIGIDVSRFNSMITESKLLDYNISSLKEEVKYINSEISKFELNKNIKEFEKELYNKLNEFNKDNFPSLIFKDKNKEKKYGQEKEEQFLKIYKKLVEKYNIKLKQNNAKSFIDKWYTNNVRQEIDFTFNLIKKVKQDKNKRILAIILSRTIRSCRATTHSDLATLKQPQLTPYYCWKHKKICKPLFSIKYWFNRYAKDTISRIEHFQKIKQSAYWSSITADSREIDIFKKIRNFNSNFYNLLKTKKIKGIFSSPPYVGQIDYHEQHAYAYDLFGFNRKDELEIGPLYKGKGSQARESYIQGISQVLLNCKRFLSSDFDIFLVANDKWNLYPQIAEQANLKIVNRYKRPVLNRTERDKNPYSETVFHLKNK